MSNTRTEDKHKASLPEICRQRFIADARHLPRGVSRSEKYSMLHIWNVWSILVSKAELVLTDWQMIDALSLWFIILGM